MLENGKPAMFINAYARHFPGDGAANLLFDTSHPGEFKFARRFWFFFPKGSPWDAQPKRTENTGGCIYKKVGTQSAEHFAAFPALRILDGDQAMAVVKNGVVEYWNLLANGIVGRHDVALLIYALL